MKKEFTASIYLRCNIEDVPRVLLVRHKKFGQYVPVGGRLEPNETPFEAATRELIEETGFIHFSKLQFMEYEEHPAGEDLHMNFAFSSDLASTDPASIRRCEEWMDPAWVTEAPPDSPPAVRRLVLRSLGSPRKCEACGGHGGYSSHNIIGDPLFITCGKCNGMGTLRDV